MKTNKYLKANRYGFSLVEIVVVIAIMAVMTAILAPALLGHVERSKMRKDEASMAEVVNAIRMSVVDEKSYGEVLSFASKGNVSCYIDETDEDLAKDDKIMLASELNLEEDAPNYKFQEKNVYSNGVKRKAAGNMNGVTITFIPQNGKYVVYDAVMNKYIRPEGHAAEDIAKNRVADEVSYFGFIPNYAKSPIFGTMSGNPEKPSHLYGDVKETVGIEIPISSNTYKHSAYTVFIRVGNDADVYGQYNGADLDMQPDEKSGPMIPNPSAPDPIPPKPVEKPEEKPETSNPEVNPDPVTPIEPEPEVHEHEYMDYVTDPTCTEKGYTLHMCDCGKNYTDNFKNPLGHDWDEGVVTKEPTTKEKGIKTYKCKRCTATKTEEIAPKKEAVKLSDGNYFVGVKKDVLENANKYRKTKGVQSYKIGDELPEVSNDHVYIDHQEMCEYRYNHEYNNKTKKWELNESMNGWGVKVVSLTGKYNGGQVTTNLFKGNLNNKPLKSMAYAFAECGSLQKVPTIPDTVKNLDYAFINQNSIYGTIEIPNSVESMVGTFEGCKTAAPDFSKATNLKNLDGCFKNAVVGKIKIPQNVESMVSAFEGATLDYSAGYPDFNNATKLKSMKYCFRNAGIGFENGTLVIPESVTDLTGTFQGANGLCGTIVFKGNNFAGKTENCFIVKESWKSAVLEGNQNNKALLEELASQSEKVSVKK